MSDIAIIRCIGWGIVAFLVFVLILPLLIFLSGP